MERYFEQRSGFRPREFRGTVMKSGLESGVQNTYCLAEILAENVAAIRPHLQISSRKCSRATRTS